MIRRLSTVNTRFSSRSDISLPLPLAVCSSAPRLTGYSGFCEIFGVRISGSFSGSSSWGSKEQPANIAIIAVQASALTAVRPALRPALVRNDPAVDHLIDNIRRPP